MDPPARKRGRPRKDEKKKRGRKPNPDKLKSACNVAPDKPKKMAEEQKPAGKDESRKRKKIAEEQKTASEDETSSVKKMKLASETAKKDDKGILKKIKLKSETVSKDNKDTLKKIREKSERLNTLKKMKEKSGTLSKYNKGTLKKITEKSKLLKKYNKGTVKKIKEKPKLLSKYNKGITKGVKVKLETSSKVGITKKIKAKLEIRSKRDKGLKKKEVLKSKIATKVEKGIIKKYLKKTIVKPAISKKESKGILKKDLKKIIVKSAISRRVNKGFIKINKLKAGTSSSKVYKVPIKAKLAVRNTVKKPVSRETKAPIKAKLAVRNIVKKPVSRETKDKEQNKVVQLKPTRDMRMAMREMKAQVQPSKKEIPEEKCDAKSEESESSEETDSSEESDSSEVEEMNVANIAQTEALVKPSTKEIPKQLYDAKSEETSSSEESESSEETDSSEEDSSEDEDINVRNTSQLKGRKMLFSQRHKSVSRLDVSGMKRKLSQKLKAVPAAKDKVLVKKKYVSENVLKEVKRDSELKVAVKKDGVSENIEKEVKEVDNLQVPVKGNYVSENVEKEVKEDDKINDKVKPSKNDISENESDVSEEEEIYVIDTAELKGNEIGSSSEEELDVVDKAENKGKEDDASEGEEIEIIEDAQEKGTEEDVTEGDSIEIIEDAEEKGEEKDISVDEIQVIEKPEEKDEAMNTSEELKSSEKGLEDEAMSTSDELSFSENEIEAEEEIFPEEQDLLQRDENAEDVIKKILESLVNDDDDDVIPEVQKILECVEHDEPMSSSETSKSPEEELEAEEESDSAEQKTPETVENGEEEENPEEQKIPVIIENEEKENPKGQEVSENVENVEEEGKPNEEQEIFENVENDEEDISAEQKQPECFENVEEEEIPEDQEDIENAEEDENPEEHEILENVDKEGNFGEPRTPESFDDEEDENPDEQKIIETVEVEQNPEEDASIDEAEEEEENFSEQESIENAEEEGTPEGQAIIDKVEEEESLDEQASIDKDDKEISEEQERVENAEEEENCEELASIEKVEEEENVEEQACIEKAEEEENLQKQESIENVEEDENADEQASIENADEEENLDEQERIEHVDAVEAEENYTGLESIENAEEEENAAEKKIMENEDEEEKLDKQETSDSWEDADEVIPKEDEISESFENRDEGENPEEQEISESIENDEKEFDAMETTSEEDNDETEKSTEAAETAIDVQDDGTIEFSEELKTVRLSLEESETRKILENLADCTSEGSEKDIPFTETDFLSYKDHIAEALSPEMDSAVHSKLGGMAKSPIELIIPENKENDNSEQILSEKIPSDDRTDEIKNILREYNSAVTKESGMESVCITQPHVSQIQESIDVKSCSVESPEETNQHEDAQVITDIPSKTRVEIKLPECYVLLHRLTDEEIYQSYTTDVENEIKNDVRCKTEELLRITEETLEMDTSEPVTVRKYGAKRSSRSKINPDLFKFYKQRRQGYINRRHRTPHSDNISDNSLDWSLEDFKTASDSGKKKKSKRGRKYELDFEWSPALEKTPVQASKRLRRQVRRPVIDSDSSSSDENEILFDMYMNEFNSNNSNSENSALQNSVPSSENEYEHDTSTFNTSGNDLTFKQGKNSSHNHVYSNSNSNNSGDIISDIIKDMNQMKGQTFVTYQKENSSISTSLVKEPSKRGRKRLKFSESSSSANSIEAQVGILLKDMVNKVSVHLKQRDEAKAFSKVCKWCATPFVPNRANELMCAICCDLGKNKYYTANTHSKKSSKSHSAKYPKENKITKRKSDTLSSRVLKIMPKSDKQRIMYTEKAVSSEKGYNHCKSFYTPKEVKKSSVFKDSTDLNKSVTLHEDSIKLNEKKKKSSHTKKNKSEKSPKHKISSKSKNNGLIQSKSKESASKNDKFSEKDFVQKSTERESLFPLTFPNSCKSVDKTIPQMSEKLKAQETAKQISKISDKKELTPNVGKNQHDTYLFPPIPTVIVSNYCNDSRGLNLSHTYFQNEITHKHALKNSMSSVQSQAKVDQIKTRSPDKSVNLSGNVVQFQNHSLPASNMLHTSSSLTITTIPITSTVNQILPFSNNAMSILNPVIPSPQKVTILPIVQSVVSLSDKNLNQPKDVQKSVESKTETFPPNNFVNSQHLQIKITNVSSEKSYKRKNVDNSVNEEVAKRPEISTTNAESKSSHDDVMCPEENSRQNSSPLITGGNKTKLTLNTDELTKQSLNISLKESDKASEDKDDAISSAMAILGAVSILAVVDLGKNPQAGLNVRIQVTNNNLAKLTSEKNVTPELNEQIASCRHNLTVLNIAKKYLSLYGSFAKVSDYLLRKAKMIQIKKEILEESNQSSCMYSQSSQSNNSLSQIGLDESRNSSVSASPSNKLENYNSCRRNEQSSVVSHIEKLQSQIAAMNNTPVLPESQYDTGGTVHHFPSEHITAIPPAVAAPTPITPRNDCMGGESRETPSRGSGPRTPARPESAASQSEEQSLIQIKKELMETDSTPSSQCAYSQNSALPHISSQLTVMPALPSISMPEHSIPNTTIHQIPVSNTNHQLYSNQTSLSIQPVEVAPPPPNRTVSYNNNQNFSDVLLNIATNHQVSPTVPGSEMGHNRQVVMGQQMYIQNDSRLCAKQPVPSVNNQYVIRPPFTPSNNGGTVIVNNPQVGQNNLLTNVSNQQFYSPNPVSQVYYPASSQITCVPSTTQTSSVASTHIQQAEVSPEQMVCAVCKSQATLRCKQCARVAYCNTTCAKTYWHQRHKMECRPLPS